MGSTTDLPSASSPSLTLTHPSTTELPQIWAANHHMWGAALTQEAYIARERYLTTIPLAKNSGLTHWILTTSSPPSSSSSRPILSSCESLRKPALAVSPSGEVTEGIAHGIASVFTSPEYRGKGYASRMMKELGPRLENWQADEQHPSLFSVLYSDIGKQFYAKNGWAAFESAHLSFPPVHETPSVPSDSQAQPIIGFDSLEELCAKDEELLRAVLVRRAKESGRTAVALAPSLDQILWHLYREDFVTNAIFNRTPSIRGAVYGSPGKRVWALWMRGYYGGIEKIEGNTLHILRFVLEDEGSDEEYLARGVKEIVEIAQKEAAEWKIAEVQVWNPGEKLKALVGRSGVKFDFVDRDKDSIASLMWYGEGKTADVDWVYNEKYAWC